MLKNIKSNGEKTGNEFGTGERRNLRIRVGADYYNLFRAGVYCACIGGPFGMEFCMDF